jgi:hypothetical protein
LGKNSQVYIYMFCFLNFDLFSFQSFNLDQTFASR